MAALFGPLVGFGAGSAGPYSSSSGIAASGSPGYYGQPGWEGYLRSWRAAAATAARPRPIYPAPPVKNFDTPNGLPTFGPPPAVNIVGGQQTRADRLFGPLARLGANSNGPGMLSSAPFPQS